MHCYSRFKSTLISGEGLTSMGESGETVRSDIGKIHQENVVRLAALSKAEVLEEKEQIEKALGKLGRSLLVGCEFCCLYHRTRSSGIHKEDRTTTANQSRYTFAGKCMIDTLVSSGPAMEGVPPVTGSPAASVMPPDGWLHMDVIEKDKLEWMTDMPPTPPNLKIDKMGSRFSLDGLVIPRGVDVPSHLGLHHHGDEPQVRYTESLVSLSLMMPTSGGWLHTA